MVTSRSLRLALLGLLLFMLCCLVVLELILQDRRMLIEYSRQRSNLVHLMQRPMFGKSSATNRSVPHGAVSLLPASTAHHSPTGEPRSNTLSVASKPESPFSPQLASSNETESGLTLKKTSLIAHRLPNPSVVSEVAGTVDNCLYSQRETSNSGLKFIYRNQTLADGTRPQNCSQCFNSNFTPLIENCGVCNSVGQQRGGGRGVVEVVMVVVILTTHKAVDKRRAIRDTWASISRNNTAHVRHVFLLGRAKEEADMQRMRQEQERYGDIIMYDFVDSYFNLTLKTLTGMHWAVRFCRHARFLLKADDDMWINIPALLSTVSEMNGTLHTVVGGACKTEAFPIRNNRSKWYASHKAYPQKTYPGYCSGTTYVTSLNVAQHVLAVSPDVPFFYLEDVYVALCIQRLGPPFHLQRLPGFYHGAGPSCKLKSQETMTVHQVKPARLREIWNTKC